MIFPILEVEEIVQVDDKTRLDGTKSYITQDEDPIWLVEIEPEAAAGFVDVTTDKYLDWQYSTDGAKVVSIRITTSPDEGVTLNPPVTKTKSMTVVTVADDYLFSSDQDIRVYEDDILKYVRAGRNSFLDKHRAAQKDILDELDRRRIYNEDGTRLSKEQIIDKVEIQTWSKFKTLEIIFRGISNAVDDVFFRKAEDYKAKAMDASKQAVIRLDLNSDDEVTQDERLDTFTLEMYRR